MSLLLTVSLLNNLAISPSFNNDQGASGKELACQCRNLRDGGSLPGLGRSPGGGNGHPYQYSCLENPMDRGSWWAIVLRTSTVQAGHLKIILPTLRAQALWKIRDWNEENFSLSSSV